MPTLRLINKAIEAAVSARCFPIRGRKIFADSAGDIFVKISLTTYNTEQGKNDGDFQKFLSYFPFSWGNTGVFQKRRIKQEIFSGLFGISNAKRAIPATAKHKKAGNLVADFLLGVPPSGGGYSVVSLSVKPELE